MVLNVTQNVCKIEQELIIFYTVWVHKTAAAVLHAAEQRVGCYEGHKLWWGRTLWVSVSERRNENTGVTHSAHLKTHQWTADKSFLSPIHWDNMERKLLLKTYTKQELFSELSACDSNIITEGLILLLEMQERQSSFQHLRNAEQVSFYVAS